MSSSTIDKAAIDGTDTRKDVPLTRREHGIENVREQVIFNLTGLAESALYEAERLVDQVKKIAFERIYDYDGSKGTEPIDEAMIAKVVTESLDCIDVAAEYLSRLSTDIRMRQDDELF